jgi:DNA sulfur modification protein DndB
MEATRASTELNPNFAYVFPAIRGVQAGREYYVSMCPLRLLSKLFQFDDEEMLPELRAQRTLNKGRIPEIARYIVGNTSTYTFSAITASIDGEIQFTPIGQESTAAFRMGTMTVSMDAKFIVNDGQHRRAAIEAALPTVPELSDETIAVVFFADRGLQRCQQMFADLNRHAVRPSASLGILYDHRSAAAKVVKHLSITSPIFRNLIETERSNLSARSRKLFTLSALHFATLELLPEKELEDFQRASKRCHEFWEAVGAQIPEWLYVRDAKMTAGDVRRDFIHCHAIVLQALGRAGRALYDAYPNDVHKRIQRLKGLDWSRRNAQTWEGRAMVGGKMSKSGQNVTLTSNELKRVLGLKLTEDERAAESALQAARPSPSKKTRISRSK